MVKLKDVEGLLIEHKDVEGMRKIFGPGSFDVGMGVGHNECRYQIGQREIGHNREKLARELHWIDGINSNPKLREKAWEISRQKEEYYLKADKLISAEASILEFRQEKGK